jgi:hypothetical protein
MLMGTTVCGEGGKLGRRRLPTDEARTYGTVDCGAYAQVNIDRHQSLYGVAHPSRYRICFTSVDGQVQPLDVALPAMRVKRSTMPAVRRNANLCWAAECAPNAAVIVSSGP